MINDTAKVREKLATVTGTFTAMDFAADIGSIHSILGKMYRKGEIALVGLDLTTTGKPPKMFKVVKLKEPPAHKKVVKCSVPRSKKAVEIPPYVKLWAEIYPDIIVPPDFSKYKQTTRTHVLDTFEDDTETIYASKKRIKTLGTYAQGL